MACNRSALIVSWGEVFVVETVGEVRRCVEDGSQKRRAGFTIWPRIAKNEFLYDTYKSVSVKSMVPCAVIFSTSL